MDHRIGKGLCESCTEPCNELYYYDSDELELCCRCSFAQQDYMCEECEKRNN